MRVVLGICGLGNGHRMRQRSIIEYLQKAGHRLCIVTARSVEKFFSESYPNIPVVYMAVPWISANAVGINFAETLDAMPNASNFLKDSFSCFRQIESFLGGVADIALTDYEPYAAQYAFARELPLVCLEQQSKFMGFDTPNISGYSRHEESARLNYFFPNASARLCTSFFPMEYERTKYPVHVFKALIGEDVRIVKEEMGGNTNEKMILVYLSPFAPSPPKLINAIAALAEKPDNEIHVFGELDSREILSNEKNIFFEEFDRKKFIRYLCCSRMVLSTSGHQLISEAIALEVPVLTIPFGTYEQHFNAYSLEKYNLGKNGTFLSKKEIYKFLESAEYYSLQIKKYNTCEWSFECATIMEFLNAKYGL